MDAAPPLPADTTRRKAGFILAIFFIFEGAFVLPPLLLHPMGMLKKMGLAPGPHVSPLIGWALGAVVAVFYLWHSAKLPSVRENLFRISWLKLLAVGVALVAGILEEYFFREMVMDWTLAIGLGAIAQVFFSAVAFGVPHGIWAFFRGSFAAGVGAILATGVLGGMLGIVYLASNRTLGPCITAHFWINAFAEPGLVLAAIRGEMGRSRK